MNDITAKDFYKAAKLMHHYCAAQACCSGCGAEDVCYQLDYVSPRSWGFADVDETPEEQRPDGWIKFSDRMPDTDCIVYEANSGRVLYAVHSEWEAIAKELMEKNLSTS